jgi:Alg9-like mannosyltransferase family
MRMPHLPALPFWGGLLAVFLGWRLLGSSLVQTYANPDEWWQAPEIAHSLVYKSGYDTWEWWPEFQLRSFCHPLLLAAFMVIGEKLQILGGPQAVAAVPKVVHAVLAAIQDVAVLLLAFKVYGSPAFESDQRTRKHHSRYIAVCCGFALMFNWFLAWGMPRPFVNSLEASLSTLSLLLWVIGLEREALRPGDDASSGQLNKASGKRSFHYLLLSCLIAGINIGLRPTAAIPWVVIALHGLISFGPQRFFTSMVPPAVLGGLVGLGATVGIDSYFYGELTFPLLSFLKLNFLHGVDRYYGAYSPIWYLIDGLPATCAVYLPMIAVGIAAAFPSKKLAARRKKNDDAPPNGGENTGYEASAPLSSVQLLPALIAGWDVFALSCTAHKEHRFLLPLAGIFAMYAGRGIWTFLHLMPPQSERFKRCYNGLANAIAPPYSHQQHGGPHGDDSDGLDCTPTNDKASSFVMSFKRVTSCCRTDRWFSCAGLLTLAIVNAIACVYFNVIHQRGAVGVAKHLSNIAEEASGRLVVIPPTLFRDDDSTALQRSEFAGSKADISAISSFLNNNNHFLPGIPKHAISTGPITAVPASSLMSVHFLMQCHSTPYHAAVHNPLVQMVQLDCSPPMARESEESEANLWRRDPAALLERMYGPNPTKPVACNASGLYLGNDASNRLSRDVYSSFASLASQKNKKPSGIPPHMASHSTIRRSLPTHIVAFDSDVDDDPAWLTGGGAFASWLNTHRYLSRPHRRLPFAGELRGGGYFVYRPSAKVAETFFFALHGADAHSQGHRDPTRVVIYEHECWRKLLQEEENA